MLVDRYGPDLDGSRGPRLQCPAADHKFLVCDPWGTTTSCCFAIRGSRPQVPRLQSPAADHKFLACDPWGPATCSLFSLWADHKVLVCNPRRPTTCSSFAMGAGHTFLVSMKAGKHVPPFPWAPATCSSWGGRELRVGIVRPKDPEANKCCF